MTYSMSHPNIAITGYHVMRTQNTWWCPRLGLHIPSRRVAHLSDHQAFTESLISTCAYLYWLRHVPPGFHVTAYSLYPLLLDVSVFGVTSFPGHRDRPGLLFFLGQTSHKGNEASLPGSTGCSCAHTASGTRCLPSLTCSFVYIVFLRSSHAKRKEPRDPNSPSLPCNAKLPSICQVYIKSCLLA